MKKIICLSTLILFLGFVSFAQNAQSTVIKTTAKKSTCKPMSPEECAKKMGMSLEAYQKLPKNCSSSKTASVEKAASQSIAIPVVHTQESTKKACCSSLEACAKKMGMTVEECLKLCPSKSAKLTSTEAIQEAKPVKTTSIIAEGKK